MQGEKKIQAKHVIHTRDHRKSHLFSCFLCDLCRISLYLYHLLLFCRLRRINNNSEDSYKTYDIK